MKGILRGIFKGNKYSSISKVLIVILTLNFFINYSVDVQALEKTNTVEANYGNNEIKSVDQNKFNPLIGIETPINNEKVKNILKIKGWALNNSAVKEVKLYIDNKFVKLLKHNIHRDDINEKFPKYLNADKSGFEDSIDISQYKVGNHSIKIEAIGNDGTTKSELINIIIERSEPLMWIESPHMNEVKNNTLDISGWALNDSGVKNVNLYMDGKYIKEVKYGNERLDVYELHKQYTNSKNSGFRDYLDLTSYNEGIHVVKIEVVGNDGSTNYQEVIIDRKKKESKMWVEKPAMNEVISNKLEISGWAINDSKIKSIKVYIDGKYIKDLEYGIERQDIQSEYPEYENSLNSGYKGILDIESYSEGQHLIKVEAVEDDGSINYQEVVVNRQKKESKMWIETPSNGSIETYKVNISGWALNDSGVNSAKLYVDGKYVSDLKYGQLREDVNSIYPGYLNGINSGFEGSLDLKPFTEGYHTLTVKIIGNDDSKIEQSMTIYRHKNPSKIWVDTPASGNDVSKKIKVSGWALNDSEINKINVYVNGEFMSTLNYGTNRSDVVNVYPGYPGGETVGFEGELDLSNFINGQYTIYVESIGRDGSVDGIYIPVYIKNKKLVVIDPGHNINSIYNVDTGSICTHNGKVYREAELDMELSINMKKSLEDLGYDVVLTQGPFQSIYDKTVKEGLQRRVDLANSLNADVFLSVHHNNYTSPNAYGTEVWYSDYREIEHIPNAPEDSEILAKGLANTLAKAGDFFNRGAKEGNLYVTKNTKMPSVLIEAGFLSNPNDAMKAADEKHQIKVANAMANYVDKWFSSK